MNQHLEALTAALTESAVTLATHTQDYRAYNALLERRLGRFVHQGEALEAVVAGDGVPEIRRNGKPIVRFFVEPSVPSEAEEAAKRALRRMVNTRLKLQEQSGPRGNRATRQTLQSVVEG